MSSSKLVINDLHLSDGATVLDMFGRRQQTALTGFLEAAAREDGPFASESLELIINGDSLDFLVAQPYDHERQTDEATSLAKLERILLAHQSFVESMRSFLQAPGRSLRFIIGNHDLELVFPGVQARLTQAFTGQSSDERVIFHPDRYYLPYADVRIEHGNYFDFWNHAQAEIWDEDGKRLSTPIPSPLPTPYGSWYYQRVAYLMSLKYPYFDHFEPSMNIARQIAILSLLDPQLVRSVMERVLSLLSFEQKLPTPEETDTPVRLFEAAMGILVVMQADMSQRKVDWHHSVDTETSSNALQEFASLYEALQLPLLEAGKAIFRPAVYNMGEAVARGMSGILAAHPSLRYIISGHTHMARLERLQASQQTYINTGTWTARYGWPDQIDDALFAWLQKPDLSAVPLPDYTQFRFVWLREGPGAEAEVDLCRWEGEHFRILNTVEE